MNKAIRRAVCVFLVIVFSTLIPGLDWNADLVSAQQGSTNLLVNGGFEDSSPGWPMQWGIPEVQIAPGWQAYWVESPPEGVIAPQYWKRPEFRDVKSAEFPYRVRSGWLAQKYFSFGGQHMAGLYQHVTNITPGTELRFSVYAQTWSCMPGDEWNICPTGSNSNSPAPMHTRVGIDPYGGTDPWSPHIIWSPEVNAYDAWTLIQVDAVAQAGAVTVFTYSYADWFDTVFRINNDVYLDDASLIALNEAPPPTATSAPPTATATLTSEPPAADQPTSTPADTPTPMPTPSPTATLDPSLPTATPAPTFTPADTPTPVATATPRPDGAIVHTVQAGDTLNAIAARYNVPSAQVEELNDLANANLLLVGQELVISVPTPTVAAATATHTPAPTATETPAPTSTSTATQSPPSATPSLTATPEAETEASAQDGDSEAVEAAIVQEAAAPSRPSPVLVGVLIGIIGIGVAAMVVIRQRRHQ